jgi:mono/diheme cytochrome c family protein
MLRPMAKPRSARGRSTKRVRPATSRSKLVWIVLIAAAVAVCALPAWRAWWRLGEASPLRRGLVALESEGCVGCHRAPDGAWTWRADGRARESLAAVEHALRRGRPATIGLGGTMPAAIVRPGSVAELRVVLAVGATSGLVGIPVEPELAVGYEIATDAGCFSCHGPLGAGGVPAPGTLAGEVPGWHGRSFGTAVATTAAIRQAVVEGARPSTLPWARRRGGRLAMPAYGDVLDSTEIESVVRYVEWLQYEGLDAASP